MAESDNLSNIELGDLKMKWMTSTRNQGRMSHLKRVVWLASELERKQFRVKDFRIIYESIFNVKIGSAIVHSIFDIMKQSVFMTSIKDTYNTRKGSGGIYHIFHVPNKLQTSDQMQICRAWRDKNNNYHQYLRDIKKKVKKQVPKKISPSQRVKKISTSLNSDLSNMYDYLISKQLAMPMGRQEDEIGERIANALLFHLPYGGSGLLIGTPTALAASADVRYPYFIMSNFLVAWALKQTTDEKPRMFLGNGVDPDKSNLKIEHWKKIGLIKDYIIKTGVVDDITFPMSVAEIASQYETAPCKAVLMTSGHWEGTTSKKNYDLDCCFRRASHHLVKRYSNLHLLVMTYNVRKTGRYFGLKYLHRDTIKEL